MNNIQSLESKIRDYVNSHNLYKNKYYKDTPDKWNMLCVSMDTLGDTCQALLDFELKGIEGDFGEKYLRLYGFLQAIFIQQDAIRYLCKSFLQFSLELKSLYEKLRSSSSHLKNWDTIRKLRNLTAGHPIEMKRDKIVKRCFITRVSISSHGFTLLVYNANENKDEFKHIDLQEVYSGYKGEATSILEEILNNLGSRESYND